MIGSNSILTVIDNSGVRTVKCLKVLKYHKGRAGALLVIDVKKVAPDKKFSKGMVTFGLLASLRYKTKRKTGNELLSDRNAVILVKKKEQEASANRIFYPVYNELRFSGFSKIMSIATDIY
jgi:large subunit ribosomal protein L14